MSTILKKLGKLKGRSRAELRLRGAQALSAYSERFGLAPLARIPSDTAFFELLDASLLSSSALSAESLLEHFRSRTSPKFFAAFNEREETMKEFRRRYGQRDAEAITERARRIIEGRFDLLGFRGLSFGNPPDWHLEPVSKKRTPLVHWSRINYLDADVAGDKKIIWELNRHQHFQTLGRAYWLTNDERFAETFAAHLNSWMDENPPKLGINWASSLEVSFRAISWLWACYFFKDSPHLTPPLFLRALKFLYLHARHLETYLSTYFSPNTHLTGEALGLYYLGTLWPEFREAARWRALGQRILLDALDAQVQADGVYFEQTSYYQRYTTDFYTHFYLLAEANGERVEAKLKDKLAAMLDHLMYITGPDGTTPFFGDDDGGRLVMLDERPINDFRAALSNGAALFARSDYKYVARAAAEETLWLMGCKSLRAFDELSAQPPLESSRAFSDGGYYVMRDGWSAAADYLLIDCGPHGAVGGAHAHADALSFSLAARGRTLLVDPATYTYTGSDRMRDLFRSSAMHNTLTIDGESSSVPDGPFRWKHTAQSSVRRWISRERFDFFEGGQDGYERLPAPATHLRSLLFVKGGYWIMRDRVHTKGTHRYDLHFHFSPDANPIVEHEEAAAVAIERPTEAPGLEIFAFGNKGRWHMKEGLVSRCYGDCSAAPVCTFTIAEAAGEQELLTFLIPRGAQASRFEVREMAATGGRAFAAREANICDYVLIGTGGLVEADRFASDFEWAWARFADDEELPEELILIDGRRFFLDGREIVSTPERAEYVYARRERDELHVEINGRMTIMRLPIDELNLAI
ncbi:MAG TPA: alginate lyase family protein [Pyrinomonadaceae bacterium]|jgi:hypothetical protein